MEFLEPVIRFYVYGGWLMHPILVLGLVGLVVATRQSWRLLRARRIDLAAYSEMLARFLRHGRIDRAERLCAAAPNEPLADVLREAVVWVEPNPVPALKALTAARERAAWRLLAPARTLRRIAQLAFFGGILGTVLGVSGAFSFSWCHGMGRYGIPATISVSLLTSALGLIVATACVGASITLDGLARGSVEELDAGVARLRHAVLRLARRLDRPARRH